VAWEMNGWMNLDERMMWHIIWMNGRYEGISMIK